MSESPALVEALLAGDAAEREQLLRSADADALQAALLKLGHRRDPAAAEVLALVDSVVDDRAVRKTARRELHRLRSMGIQPPAGPAAIAESTRPASGERRVEISEAWATDIDPAGSRAIWLLGERPLGGVWFAALLLNEGRGVQEMNLVDTTRKRFQREFEASKAGVGTWVSLPGDYALRLIREAVDVGRERGGAPTRYHAFKDIFGEAESGPERALVYETISPVEASFNPDWLDESPRLLSEPEVAGWYVPVPDTMRARALEVARGTPGGLLVPGHTPEQNALQLMAEAAASAGVADVQRVVRRRLEETAYIFLSTDRLAAARRAVAAAHALEDDKLKPERHPLMRMLLASGVARLLGAEMIGGRRAGEVLLELVEHAAERQSQSAPVETRPSGLILPR